MSTHENTAPKADVHPKVTHAIVSAVRPDKGFSSISVGSVKAAA